MSMSQNAHWCLRRYLTVRNDDLPKLMEPGSVGPKNSEAAAWNSLLVLVLSEICGHQVILLSCTSLTAVWCAAD